MSQPSIPEEHITDVIDLYTGYGPYVFCGRLISFDFKLSQLFKCSQRKIAKLRLGGEDTFFHLRFTDVELFAKNEINFDIRFNQMFSGLIIENNIHRTNVYIKKIDPDVQIGYTGGYPCFIVDTIPDELLKNNKDRRLESQWYRR